MFDRASLNQILNPRPYELMDTIINGGAPSISREEFWDLWENSGVPLCQKCYKLKINCNCR